MEQIFIYPILVFTSYLLYKVFNLKSRENKLRNEKSCLQDTLDIEKKKIFLFLIIMNFKSFQKHMKKN